MISCALVTSHLQRHSSLIVNHNEVIKHNRFRTSRTANLSNLASIGSGIRESLASISSSNIVEDETNLAGSSSIIPKGIGLQLVAFYMRNSETMTL
jgi:hypothetical protein